MSERWHSAGEADPEAGRAMSQWVGSSFTEYRGRGFWARDSKLEIWLYLLVKTIDRHNPIEPWLSRARDDWHIQATAGMTGCVCASLDEHLGDRASHVATLIVLAEEAERGLIDGQAIPVSELARAGVGGDGCTWTCDVDPAVIQPIARAFIDLVEGRIAWDASTSPAL